MAKIKGKTYELWAYGYNKNEEITDYDEYLAEFPHTDKGLEDALQLLREVKLETLRLDGFDNVDSICLVVEEVFEFPNGETSAQEVKGTRWLQR